MKLNPRRVNLFLLAKLPAAFLCGVRLCLLNEDKCMTSVTHRWVNQNPFGSMYFAVQLMAAELSTGAIIMNEIECSGKNISMLVISNSATYHKKATGKILFTCHDVHMVRTAIEAAFASGIPQTISMKSAGTNEDGVIVSEMIFNWSVRVR